MELINLTPHDITILAYLPDGAGLGHDDILRIACGKKYREITRIPSSGVARLKTEIERVGHVQGVPLTRTTFGEPECLPEPQEGRYYNVSAVVKYNCPDRDDLVVPAEVVRNGSGQIIGCCALSL